MHCFYTSERQLKKMAFDIEKSCKRSKSHSVRDKKYLRLLETSHHFSAYNKACYQDRDTHMVSKIKDHLIADFEKKGCLQTSTAPLGIFSLICGLRHCDSIKRLLRSCPTSD